MYTMAILNIYSRSGYNWHFKNWVNPRQDTEISEKKKINIISQ
jgi:hypothetical protein